MPSLLPSRENLGARSPEEFAEFLSAKRLHLKRSLWVPRGIISGLGSSLGNRGESDTMPQKPVLPRVDQKGRQHWGEMLVFILLAEPKELVDLANTSSYSQGQVKGRRAIIPGSLIVFVPAVVFVSGRW